MFESEKQRGDEEEWGISREGDKDIGKQGDSERKVREVGRQ